jgi:hypothetical protein
MRLDRTEGGAIGCSLFSLLFWLAYFVGTVLCIIKLIHCDFQAPYKAEILYTIGMLTPAGIIIGFLNFGR